MAIVLEQTHASALDVATSPATISMGNTKVGSLLIVATAFGSAALNSVTGVTDGGDSFTKLFDLVSPGSNATTFWYAFNVAARTTPTISIAFNDAVSDLNSICREYSGVTLTDPLDKSASSSGTSAAANSGASASLSQGNQLLIGIVGDSWGSGQTYTPTNSFINSTSLASNQSTDVQLMDRLVSSGGAYTATATLGNSTTWVAAIATFKALQPSFATKRLPNYGSLRPAVFKPGLAR